MINKSVELIETCPGFGRLEIAVECDADGSTGFETTADGETVFTNCLEVRKLGRGATFTAKIGGELHWVRPSGLMARIVVRSRDEIVTFDMGK